MNKFSQFLFAMLLFVALAPVSFAENTNKGYEAFQSGDYAKAHKLWVIEAEQGDEFVQCNLGVMYEKGLGVPQDYKEAAKWFLKAAEQGNVNAQTNLGVMYFEGKGVLQSYEDSYAWLVIAAASGNEVAIENFEIAQMNMSPEQIKRGQQIANEIWSRMKNK
ncbi:MAG: sel1 repeat family protein [Deltaproteobacteria bacterium]|jgi:TPR repeat protein|nr:sel1 repeat family protein [Deltaproteobacteria bacterium]